MTAVPVAEDPALMSLLDQRRTDRAAGDPPRRRTQVEVEDGLLSWMRDLHDGDVGVAGVHRFAGGGTNELYAFTLTASGVERELVLRIKIPGSGVVTHPEREFALMRAAAPVLPVPEALFLTSDTRYFGAPALVVARVPGVQSARDSVIRASGMGTTYPARLRGRLGREFVSFEALLHAQPLPLAELTAFVVPRDGTTDAIDWRLAFWDQLWEDDKLEEHPVMRLTRDWLWEHRPVVDRVSLLHGDFRNGNFLFDEDTGEITSVLDWEMGWLGDRHADLAYTMFRSFGEVVDGAFLVAGLVDADEFVRAYEATSGLPVDPERLRYYAVFNMYWSNVSLMATGLRNACAGRTQLDAMYMTMAGMGVTSYAALMSVIGRPRP